METEVAPAKMELWLKVLVILAFVILVFSTLSALSTHSSNTNITHFYNLMNDTRNDAFCASIAKMEASISDDRVYHPNEIFHTFNYSVSCGAEWCDCEVNRT